MDLRTPPVVVETQLLQAVVVAVGGSVDEVAGGCLENSVGWRKRRRNHIFGLVPVVWWSPFSEDDINYLLFDNFYEN